AVARAVPDGYTFLFTNTSGMAINPISFRQLPYDPTRDFTAVAMVCNHAPQMVSVNAELPARTLPELIAYAKANRGKLSMAFDTTAGAAAFAAKLFNRRADLGLVEVPYRSAAQMTQDVASGFDHVMMSSIAVARSIVETGGPAHRHNLGATLSRLTRPADGQRNVVLDGFFAVVGPAGVPPEIIARLNQDIAEYLKGAEIQQRLIAFGLDTDRAGTPDGTAQSIRELQEHWRALAKELDIEPQ